MATGEGLSNKISNVMGVVLPTPIRRQFLVRSQKNVSSDFPRSFQRDDENLLYIANKGAWVRLVSSVNTRQNRIEALGIDSLQWAEDETSLAKNFVLFGGSSMYRQTGSKQQDFLYDLRAGLGYGGSYGTLGEQEINQFGYRPMPGIIDAKIGVMGKLGSIRKATINIKAWDKLQLDILDTLYFKLGYTMLLEWGHVMYFDNSDEPKLQRGEMNKVNPFWENSNKDWMQREIAMSIRKSDCNYDAMIGMCTKFNYSLNQEGGFDCSIELQALGTLADSVKINQPQALPDYLKYEVQSFVDYENTRLRAEEAKRVADRNIEIAADNQKEKDNAVSDIPKGVTVDEATAGKATFRLTSPTDRTDIDKAANNIYDLVDINDATVYKRKFGVSHKCSQSPQLEEHIGGLVIVSENSIKNQKQEYESGYIDKYAKDPTKIVPGNDNLNAQVEITLDEEKIKPIINSVSALHQNQIFRCPYVGTNLTNRLLCTDSATFMMLDYVGGYIGDTAKGSDLSSNTDSTIALIKLDGITSPESITGNMKSALYEDMMAAKILITSLTGGGTLKGTIRKSTITTRSSRSAANESASSVNTSTSEESVDIVVTPFSRNLTENVNSGWKFTGGMKSGYVNSQKRFYFAKSDGSYIHFDLPSKRFQFYSFTTNAVFFIKNVYGQDIQKNIKFTLTILGDSCIKEMIPKTEENKLEEYRQKEREAVIAGLTLTPEETPKNVDLSSDDIASDEAKRFQSGLEVFLRSIQLHVMNSQGGGALNIELGSNPTPITVSLLEKLADGNSFIKKLFTTGIFSDLVGRCVKDDATIDNSELEKIGNNIGDSSSEREIMLAYAARGFSHNLMKRDFEDLGVSATADNATKLSDYPLIKLESLFTAYMYPYKINQGIIKGVDFNFPVYISLGLLIMALNHMCMIYDSPQGGPPKPGEDSTDTGASNTFKLSSENQRPLLYLDFSEKNFCLSDPLQITTDPFKFLIPCYATSDSYANLFDDGVREELTKSGSLFDADNQNAASAYIIEKHPFKDSESPFRGKIMNVLVNIDYVLKLCENFANRDDSQSVYLMQFLSQLVTDMNKSFGDINVFRVAYDDYSNCYFISDDQYQKLDKSEHYVKNYSLSESAPSTLPLYGLNSIARSLEIKTDISNKISNYIAISANSNIESDLSKDSSALSVYNKGIYDRYIAQRLSVSPDTTGSAAVNEAKKMVAIQFNDFVKGVYSTANVSEDSVAAATNYYIERMNKRKGRSKATRASAIIPISVNFTTDGIGGLAMGQSFLLPDELMPTSYKLANDEETVVGFTIMGLDHTIANNSWTTAIRANMTYLKNDDQFNSNNQEFNTALKSGVAFSREKLGTSTTSGGTGQSATGCDTDYPQLPIVSPPPPQDTLTYVDAKNYLKSKYPGALGKQVFAVMIAESAKNSARTAFLSAGGFNFGGVQTDSGKWGFGSFKGQYCRRDSERLRMFAIFGSYQDFIDFLANRLKAKGFDKTDSADHWTERYLNDWVYKNLQSKDPQKYAAKFPDKKAIYNTAETIYNS